MAVSRHHQAQQYMMDSLTTRRQKVWMRLGLSRAVASYFASRVCIDMHGSEEQSLIDEGLGEDG